MILSAALLQSFSQCTVQARAGFVGKGHRLRIAIDINRLLTRIDDQPALLTFLQMLFEFLPKGRIQGFIEVTCKLVNDVIALHCLSPAESNG
jgi:hypothetical protein